MTREWKPGELRMVAVSRWSSAKEWPDDTSAVAMVMRGDGIAEAVEDDPAAPFCVPPQCLENVRRLVVIDPEDREQVERLSLAWHNVGTGDDTKDMQTALRSLIGPPRPEEPMGDWAVVENADGEKFVRADWGGSQPWYRIGGDMGLHWDRLRATKVLSEGVQP